MLRRLAAAGIDTFCHVLDSATLAPGL